MPHSRRKLPVRGLTARVVSGVDQGKTAVSSGEVLAIGTDQSNTLVLTDPTVSRFHVELRRAPSRIEVIDLGSTNGTGISWALLRSDEVSIYPGAALDLGGTRVQVEDGPTELVGVNDGEGLGLIGRSAPMQLLAERIHRVAPLPVSVLILGDSGSGKELVAQAIHSASPRASGPFVVVDCAALHSALAASELFGHERGAFTGASQRHIGAFERAGEGTLFLDEIGELPMNLQALLLGAIERRRVKRLGGRTEVKIDTRIVAATHRDLREAVNVGRFRLDLFHRLNVVNLRVPPLAARLSDLPLLAAHFALEAGFDSAALSAAFGSNDWERLKQHRWPGNVRELRNVVLSALALGAPPPLDESEPTDSPAGTSVTEAALYRKKYHEARRMLLDDFERRFIEQALLRHAGNVRQAALSVGMDRSYLTELLKRHGLRAVRTYVAKGGGDP